MSSDIAHIIPKQVLHLLAPLSFTSIYELGNKKTGSIPYSVAYATLGISYTSIDLNGLDGALAFDLREPIDLPPRDMVSNIGTSEHVEDQRAVFNNIHNLSQDRMVHWVPYNDYHPGHGCYGYSLEFFEKLAALNNYKIEKLYLETTFKTWTLACAAFQKTDRKPFVWDDSLPLTYKPEGMAGVSYV